MYGHASLAAYRDSGRDLAAALAERMIRDLKSERFRLADWGCGLGRVLRHFPKSIEVVGYDVNARAIAWCAAHLAPARFEAAGPMPPLPASDGAFDAATAISVFTHLSRGAQEAWAAELRRVLRPGGLLLATFHVRPAEGQLLPAEAAAFDAGAPVVRAGSRSGSRLFASYHPESHLRRKLLADFEWLEGPSDFFGQSLVVARKP